MKVLTDSPSSCLRRLNFSLSRKSRFVAVRCVEPRLERRVVLSVLLRELETVENIVCLVAHGIDESIHLDFFVPLR